ncbi:hypothetical protein [Mycobacterium seoulense]|uniref:hypothetical protein n=1 Tax=Mycobacterium seoulense TaxID=386911 RepID=UPI003CEF9E09
MQVRSKRAAAWLRMKVETAFSAPIRTAERVKRPRRPGLSHGLPGRAPSTRGRRRLRRRPSANYRSQR